MTYRLWVSVYIARLDGREAPCPACAEGAVDCAIYADPGTRMGFARLTCRNCGAAERISRIQVPPGVCILPLHDDEP